MAAEMTIESLIPHRDHMKLIDEIVHVDADKAITNATVHAKWPLFAEGQVSPIVLVELVAQTAGVCIGWKMNQEDPSAGDGKGWIVGIKQAVFYVDRLLSETTVTTCSEIEYSHQNYAVFKGRASIGDAVAGEVNVQVFRPDETENS